MMSALLQICGSKKMPWFQKSTSLPRLNRGCHLITSHLLAALPEIEQVRVGLLHVFIQHTSASLTINENADPDVRRDFERALNHLVPENLPFEHTLEGPDDMPAHVKASLMGPSLTIPVVNGELGLGTWQGIYLCEHRNHGGPRNLLLTLYGDT
jgi:secondary thiamine-phosphate synthase enzyme